MPRIGALTCSLPLLFSLTACVVPSPRDYETDPVTLNTSKGPVVCQLYTANLTAWDRSVGRPEDMTVAEADKICRDHGKKMALL